MHFFNPGIQSFSWECIRNTCNNIDAEVSSQDTRNYSCSVYGKHCDGRVTLPAPNGSVTKQQSPAGVRSTRDDEVSPMQSSYASCQPIQVSINSTQRSPTLSRLPTRVSGGARGPLAGADSVRSGDAASARPCSASCSCHRRQCGSRRVPRPSSWARVDCDVSG